jgi:hypothetical protein
VRVDVHHHPVGLAVDVEAISARCTWGIQQRVDNKARGIFGGFLEPEFREIGEFFRAMGVRINGQTARGEAVLLVAVDRTEIAGAKERQDVIDGNLRGLEQLEAGESQVAF